MPENYYEQPSRFTAKLDAVSFLSWLLGLAPDEFTFRGWLDTRDLPFPGDTDRASDTVAYVADVTRHGVPWAITIEFQTQPDPLMFGRMLGYLSGLWLNRKPDTERGSRFHLGGAVVNLTGKGATSQDMSWPAVGLRTELKVVERNLEHEPAADLIAGVESGRWSRCLLPWVPLMSGADDPDLIERWKVVASAEPDRGLRGQFGAIARLFAGRVGRGAIWGTKLEDWNVEESTYVNEWIAKGEARGEARGKRQESLATILRFGSKKFGEVPAGVQTTLSGIDDQPRLNRMLDRLFDATATGWDDLLATT